MKRILLLIVFIVLVPVLLSSQQTYNEIPKDAELQKIKDALVVSVIKCQELEKENAYLNTILKKVAEDLKTITTIKQLDSLKVVYGIKTIKK